MKKNMYLVTKKRRFSKKRIKKEGRRCSSMVERVIHNHSVVGSNPTVARAEGIRWRWKSFNRVEHKDKCFETDKESKNERNTRSRKLNQSNKLSKGVKKRKKKK